MDAGIVGTVGGTRTIRLRRIAPAGSAEVWVKLEGANPTGSYKDRMAAAVLLAAVDRGDVRPGGRVVEYTGGSTGMALAFVAATLGLRFTAVSSNAFSASKLAGMRAFGAEVLIEESADGAITPELIRRMKARAAELSAEPGSWYADQFGNPDVRRGYAAIGRELADQVGRVDALCFSVGTGGGLMGTLDGLAERGIHPAAYALEPAQSPLLTTGRGGPHRVDGVGVGFEPPFLDRSRLAGVMAIDQDEAFAMARRLAAQEGLLAGASTGMNVVAALRLARELGPDARVATVACDTGLKYVGHLFP